MNRTSRQKPQACVDEHDDMPVLFLERGQEVIIHEHRRPVLYDAHDRPLVRPAGFRREPERS